MFCYNLTAYLITAPVKQPNPCNAKLFRQIIIERAHDLEEGPIRIGRKDKICIHGLTIVRKIEHLVGGRCDDSKVAARPSEGPEQVWILRPRCPHQSPRGCDDSDRLKSVKQKTAHALK